MDSSGGEAGEKSDAKDSLYDVGHHYDDVRLEIVQTEDGKWIGQRWMRRPATKSMNGTERMAWLSCSCRSVCLFVSFVFLLLKMVSSRMHWSGGGCSRFLFHLSLSKGEGSAIPYTAWALVSIMENGECSKRNRTEFVKRGLRDQDNEDRKKTVV